MKLEDKIKAVNKKVRSESKARSIKISPRIRKKAGRKPLEMYRQDKLDASNIITVLCSHYKIDIEVLKSQTRLREVVEIRQMIMTILYKMFGATNSTLTLADIGSLLGGKDHATVLYSVKAISNLCATNVKFMERFHEMQGMAMVYKEGGRYISEVAQF